MNNDELIKALKDAEGYIRYVAPSCIASDEAKEAIRVAADALEAADAKIVKLNTKCADLQSQIYEMENEIEELLPKEGEWIVEQIDDSGFKWCKWRCSACREIIKRGWQHTKDGEKPRWKYCPNCGARMRGEHDE